MFHFSWIKKLLADNQFIIMLVSVLVILSIGTLFYHTFEKWRYIDSLYFSVTTLATVGYGDFHPITDLGKAFTMGYILVGVGELLAFINLVTDQRNIYKQLGDKNEFRNL